MSEQACKLKIIFSFLDDEALPTLLRRGWVKDTMVADQFVWAVRVMYEAGASCSRR
jgi:hypothetical protein